MSVSVRSFEDDEISLGSKGSTLSISKMAIECPKCQKELQMRSMFNHIYKYHYDFFADNCLGIYKKNHLEDIIEGCKAIPLSWSVTNDFDEQEERTLYGCLACYNTLTDENKADKHCQLAKCKKEHLKKLKVEKKREDKEKADRLKAEKTTEYKQKNRSVGDIKDDIQLMLDYYTEKINSCIKMINLLIDKDKPIIEYDDDGYEIRKNERRYAFEEKVEDVFSRLCNFKFQYNLKGDKEALLKEELSICRQYWTNPKPDMYELYKICWSLPGFVDDGTCELIRRCSEWVNDAPRLSYH